MSLKFTKHEKVSLLNHPTLNEKWLQDRIADDRSILGFGDVRLLDRERAIQGGGRLDLLLLDDDNNRRYEVELQLGATNPSHIIRCIEYWDVERRRYPGYEHIAVLVAENVTTRFLNIMSLMAGSIPLIALQLDALRIGENLVLSFTRILDQTDLRVDDTDEERGGGQADRTYWDKRAGNALMEVCDSILAIVNGQTNGARYDLNYLKGYIGLQSNGAVDNFVWMAPKPTKQLAHVSFRNPEAQAWVARFDEVGVPAVSKRSGRFRISVTPTQFAEHKKLIAKAITVTMKENGIATQLEAEHVVPPDHSASPRGG